MRVDNNFNRYAVNNAANILDRKSNQNDSVAAEPLTDAAVSVEISERGLSLAGELEPFIDTYETELTLLKGVGHIGSEKMINGTFCETLAGNYQNELQKLKENYSGDEFDKKLEVLDKAYEKAAESVSRGYVKQLRMLTGDIVLKPQSAVSYATEEEAEKAYLENLEKDAKYEPIIDSAVSETIQSDVKDILLKLKNATQNQQNKENNIWGNFMSYADIKKLGIYLNGSYKNVEGISDFSKSILERYSAARIGK